MAARFFPLHPSVCFAARLWAALSVAARPGRLCPCGELRCAAPAGFVSRSGGAEGGSRKQPANISGVRGQRLVDSNPIKHRLRQPWRRAGAGSESGRVGQFRAKVERSGWGRSQREMVVVKNQFRDLTGSL